MKTDKWFREIDGALVFCGYDEEDPDGPFFLNVMIGDPIGKGQLSSKFWFDTEEKLWKAFHNDEALSALIDDVNRFLETQT